MHARWLVTVNIKDLLGEDESPEAVIAAATGIRQRMANLSSSPLANDLDLMALGDILSDFADIVEAPDVSDFNGVLDGLYDWADANRVWLGLA